MSTDWHMHEFFDYSLNRNWLQCYTTNETVFMNWRLHHTISGRDRKSLDEPKIFVIQPLQSVATRVESHIGSGNPILSETDPTRSSSRIRLTPIFFSLRVGSSQLVCKCFVFGSDRVDTYFFLVTGRVRTVCL